MMVALCTKLDAAVAQVKVEAVETFVPHTDDDVVALVADDVLVDGRSR